MRRLVAGLAILVFAMPVLAEAQSARDSTLIATIRQKGYSCDRVVSAQKDLGRSLQGRTVWYVDCHDGNYQVLYKANNKPEVVRFITHKRPSR